MIRAVLDANVLVSYLLTHRPPIATLLDRHLAREDFVLVTAPELLEELDRVLQYPKLHRYYTDSERTRLFGAVAFLAIWNRIQQIEWSTGSDATPPESQRGNRRKT